MLEVPVIAPQESKLRKHLEPLQGHYPGSVWQHFLHRCPETPHRDGAGAFCVPQVFGHLWPLNNESWREPSDGSRIVHHELQHFQVGQGRAALSSSVSAETMMCFACGEIRYKKQWSARQWDKAMQLVKGLDQWKRNCCKQCSDVLGWCFTSKLEEERSQQMSCKAADYDSGTTLPMATSRPAPAVLRSTLPFAADIDSAKKIQKIADDEPPQQCGSSPSEVDP